MKVIIPAAGLATRFLPCAKSIPKEMLPVAGKPAIQWVVEEAIDSGVSAIVLITSRGKHSIEDHFDLAPELDGVLRSRDRGVDADTLAAIGAGLPIASVRQRAPLGLGHAVLQAAPFVGEDFFTVMLPDDIYASKTPALQQLINAAVASQCSVVALMEVPLEDVSKYGIVEGRKCSSVFEVTSLVEKPAPEDAKSNLAVVGRYVLHRSAFDYLMTTQPGSGGEIQLTDALNELAANRGLVGVTCEGIHYDVGTPDGWFRANVEMVTHG
jgi:UTP--glucose-1-phosphate uridylyltransferase